MQNTDEQTTQLIYETIDEVNLGLPRDLQLGKSADTVLFGENGGLGSLETVNFLVIVEEKINADSEIPVSLIETLINSENPVAPDTVAELVKLVRELRQAALA